MICRNQVETPMVGAIRLEHLSKCAELSGWLEGSVETPGDGEGNRPVDLVVGPANRRPEIGMAFGRFCSQLLHSGQGLLADSSGGSSPTGMGAREDGCTLVIQQQRYAVGHQDSQDHSVVRRDQGVSSGDRLIEHEGPPTTIGIRDVSYRRAVHLLAQYQISEARTEESEGAAAVLPHPFGIVANMQRQVERLEGPLGTPAIARRHHGIDAKSGKSVQRGVITSQAVGRGGYDRRPLGGRVVGQQGFPSVLSARRDRPLSRSRLLNVQPILLGQRGSGPLRDRGVAVSVCRGQGLSDEVVS